MKLPTRLIVPATFETIGRYGRTFFVVALPLAIVTLAVTELLSALAAEMIGPTPSPVLIESIVWILVTPAIGAPAEIHWFRILLLGERHELRGYFRFRLRELRYTAVSIVITAFVAAPFLLAELAWTFLIPQSTDAEASRTLALQLYATHTAASIVVSTIVAAWLSPLLAAIAVDREHQGLTAIVRLTRGNRIQIGIVFLLCFELLKIGLIGLELIFGDRLDGFGFWNIVFLTYLMWTSFCYVAAAAEAYWELENGQKLQTLGAVFD